MLSTREREQVQLILCSLKEFSFGYVTADAASEELQEACAEMRFYMNALYQYCNGYFLVGGANKLRNVLVLLGSGDLLAPIDAVLQRRIGDLTFGEIIRTFRDKFLTHQTFTFAPLQEKVLSRLNLDDPANGLAFSRSLNDLFFRTQCLYLAMIERFPEAADADATTSE